MAEIFTNLFFIAYYICTKEIRYEEDIVFIVVRYGIWNVFSGSFRPEDNKG